MAVALPQINLRRGGKTFKAFLDKELKRAEDLRTGFLGELRMDDENYDAKAKPKNFPWPGSCNVRIPIIRIVTDSLAARWINTVEGHQPRIWTVRPKPGRASFVDVASAAQDFMENVTMPDTEMDMHQVLMDAIPAAIRRGTAIIKVPYVTFSQQSITYDAGLNPVEYTEVITDTVKPSYIPDEDFVVSPEGLNIETAPWVAHKVRLTREQILMRERLGHWMKGTFEKVKATPVTSFYTEAQRQSAQRTGMATDERTDNLNFWEFYEVHMRYDIKGDGRALPIVAVYHLPTGTLCRLVYNWYWHGRRPFIRIRFMARENSFYSPGIARRLRTMAKAMDTIFQQQIDNHTLANTRLWKLKAGEPGLREGFRIWAGRSIVLNDMDSIQGEQMGEPYTGSTNYAMNTLQQMIERDSAINDFNLGQESSLKSAVPATSTLAVMQEGNKRIDLSIRDLRSQFNIMGAMALSNFQQFNPTGKIFSNLDPEKGAMIDALFRLPREAIRDGVGIELTASTAQMNKDIQRQNSMSLMQISTQYYQQVIGLGQMLMQTMQQAPQFAGAVAKIIDRSAEIFERTLDTFEVEDARAFAIRMEDIIGQPQQAGGTPPPQVGGVAGAAGANGGQPPGPEAGPPVGVPS